MRRHPLVRAALISALLLLGAMAVQGCNDGACAAAVGVAADVDPAPHIGDHLRDSEGCSNPTPPPVFPTLNPPANVRGNR